MILAFYDLLYDNAYIDWRIW